MKPYEVFILVFLVFSEVISFGLDHNWKKDKLKKGEEHSTMGSGLPLVGVEIQMNNIFMNHKKADLEDAFHNPNKFPPFLHFFRSKRIIEKKKLYKIMRLFPKAANLHIHDFGMVTPEYLFNLTYSPNLYICVIAEKIHFKYMEKKSSHHHHGKNKEKRSNTYNYNDGNYGSDGNNEEDNINNYENKDEKNFNSRFEGYENDDNKEENNGDKDDVNYQYGSYKNNNENNFENKDNEDDINKQYGSYNDDNNEENNYENNNNEDEYGSYKNDFKEENNNANKEFININDILKSEDDENNNNNNGDECDWKLLEKIRKKNKFIDKVIKSQLSMIVDEPEKIYPSKEIFWYHLEHLVRTIHQLFSNRPVFKEFIKRGLQELYDDNIFYVEIKSFLPELYDLDGSVYGPIQTMQVYKEAIEEFKKEKSDFLGARVIYAPLRSVDTSVAEKYATTAIELHKKFPDHFAGFDLVGWEDKTKPLEYFSKQIELMKKNGVKFFFHAGETNYFGSHADENLFDAILFNTERIGAPVAVIKHPEILKIVKLKNIALEMLPISNQVMQIVPDITSNPLSNLIANNYPVVVGSDIPGTWGASGLSYDWYLICLGLTDKDADTKIFKQLALNSIEHSSMNNKEKAAAYAQWTHQFTHFSNKIVELNNKNDL